MHKRINYLLPIVLLIGSTIITPVRAYAVDPATINGGSNASDYHPATRNPQSDVGTGLQQNAGGLQPVSDNSSVSQESLLNAKNLQVVGTDNSKITPDKTSQLPKTKKPNRVPLLLTLVAISFISVILLLKSEKNKATGPKTVEIEAKPQKVLAPKHKKKLSKKKRKKKTQK